MNKQTIITILLALVAVAGTSDAFNFRIDHEDVAIAVNKDIAGNQVPDDKGTVGIATNSILMVGQGLPYTCRWISAAQVRHSLRDFASE